MQKIIPPVREEEIQSDGNEIQVQTLFSNRSGVSTAQQAGEQLDNAQPFLAKRLQYTRCGLQLLALWIELNERLVTHLYGKGLIYA